MRNCKLWLPALSRCSGSSSPFPVADVTKVGSLLIRSNLFHHVSFKNIDCYPLVTSGTFLCHYGIYWKSPSLFSDPSWQKTGYLGSRRDYENRRLENLHFSLATLVSRASLSREACGMRAITHLQGCSLLGTFCLVALFTVENLLELRTEYALMFLWGVAQWYMGRSYSGIWGSPK